MQSERVSDVMTSRVIQAIGPHATVAEAAKKMCQVQKGCLLVVEGARPVGILTEWDLIHKVLAKDLPLDELEVSKVMTKELISVQPEAPVSEAAKLIVKHGVHRLVVMDDGNVHDRSRRNPCKVVEHCPDARSALKHRGCPERDWSRRFAAGITHACRPQYALRVPMVDYFALSAFSCNFV
jgi:CBS domain-containing protein